MSEPTLAFDPESLIAGFRDHTATIGVIGLGYVGLPLVIAFSDAGFRVLGFDIDAAKVESLKAGRSGIRHIPDETVERMVASGRFDATDAFGRLDEPDAILICVPTPLTRHRDPDLSYVARTADAIAAALRPGQLVILESTTYPGTTDEVVKPILEAGGLIAGRDFLLAYSPEREDPGNAVYSTTRIPKVVGGDGAVALAAATVLYEQITVGAVRVSSTATAEAVKLTENIFRAVNIALVNELKAIYAKLGVDIWEVVDAASTKPFGYMPFYPGPGLGGHCIPIDPFYLTWRARELDIPTRFIELAGEINTAMPVYVVDALAEALNLRAAKAVNGARILLVGLAYKKNVDDVRESPAFKLIELLAARGAEVDYYDPYVPVIRPTREHAHLAVQRSVAWEPAAFGRYDAALICTDHDGVDYDALVRHSRFVVDTRNATRGVKEHRDRIVAA